MVRLPSTENFRCTCTLFLIQGEINIFCLISFFLACIALVGWHHFACISHCGFCLQKSKCIFPTQCHLLFHAGWNTLTKFCVLPVFLAICRCELDGQHYLENNLLLMIQKLMTGFHALLFSKDHASSCIQCPQT